MLANVVVFLGLAIAGAGVLTPDPIRMIDFGTNFGPLTAQGQWWRLLAAMFLHFGLVHIAVNMWALWGAGRLVERLYGSAPFLLLYLFAGVVGGAASVVWNPVQNSAGASGAIFGVLGAFVVALLNGRRLEIPASVVRRQLIVISAFVLLSLTAGALHPNVDNAAHFGGLLAGASLGALLIFARNAAQASRYSAGAAAAAGAWVALILLTCSLQVARTEQRLSAPQRYWASHLWFAPAEARNLQMLQQIEARMISGAISRTELAATLERDILPFWRDADERLAKEVFADEDIDAFASLIAEYVRLRHDWARTMLEATGKAGDASITDATALLSSVHKALVRLEHYTIRETAARPTRLTAAMPALRRIENWVQQIGWRCVGSAADGLAAAAAGDDRDRAAGRARAGCAAQRALAVSDFDALEALLDPAETADRFLADGSLQLEGAIQGLDALFEAMDAPGPLLERLFEWRRSKPDSAAADLIEALLYRKWAWQARGGGYANSVAPIAWAIYDVRLREAKSILERSAERSKKHPLWYELMLSIAVDLSDAADLESLFDEATASFPYYRPIYHQMLRGSLPRWSGSIAQVDELVTTAVLRTQERLGSGMYALLYWRLAEYEGAEFDLFEDSGANWPTMRRAFEDLLARYPDSGWILNGFASFACRAEDATTYASVRERMGSRHIAAAWPAGYTVQECDGAHRQPR